MICVGRVVLDCFVYEGMDLRAQLRTRPPLHLYSRRHTTRAAF